MRRLSTATNRFGLVQDDAKNNSDKSDLDVA
jgi:hypothetical protein